MDMMGIYTDGGVITTGSDSSPYDGNFQGFITPLTYVAVVTGVNHFLAMMGVGS